MSKKSLINVALIVALFLVFGISFVIGGLHTDPEDNRCRRGRFGRDWSLSVNFSRVV